jgi:hypothetical protein
MPTFDLIKIELAQQKEITIQLKKVKKLSVEDFFPSA